LSGLTQIEATPFIKPYGLVDTDSFTNSVYSSKVFNVKSYLLPSLIGILAFSACTKKNKDATAKDIVGAWQEQETSDSFAGATYRFIFRDDDSFFAKVVVYTDAIDSSNPCVVNPVSYIKGSFSVSGNQISFDGAYFDSTYLIPSFNCTGRTTYQAQYISLYKGDELILNANAPDEWGKIKLYRER